METIYLLIKEERGTIRTNIKAFASINLAELEMVKCNYYAQPMEKYFVQQLRFNQIECDGLEVTHSGEEIFIKDYSETEHVGSVALRGETSIGDEEDFYGVADIDFYGKSLEDINLTDDVRRKIEGEADDYAFEMTEEVKYG